MNFMDDLKRNVVRLLSEAGAIILSGENRKVASCRSLADITTECDYAVEAFLAPKLLELLPDSGVLAEETGKDTVFEGEYLWVLDPIDGTTNFFNGIPMYAISLALLDRQGPLMGFVFAPALRELFCAVRGQGATLNGRSIGVSNPEDFGGAVVGIGLHYDRSLSEGLFPMWREIYLVSRDLRRMGASSLDLAFVACGRLDGYLERGLKPWDYAAGILLVKEAGGMVSDWKGDVLSGLCNSDIVAGGPGVYNDLCSMIGRFYRG